MQMWRWVAASATLFVGLIALGSAALAQNVTPAGAASANDAVARGAYLARAGDCVSCHTAAGGPPYAGGYKLDTPFGYLLSPNITPDAATGIGRWTADDFYRAMHQGVNRHGQDMFPVMPFDFYTRVTREDSDALFSYLRSLPPENHAVLVNHLRFPFNQRWSMMVWRELYFSPGTYKPDPAQSAAWNRGAYLVEGLGHCSACHSPRNALGGIEKDKAYTGATVDGWFALNLSSELHTGLGSWTAEQIATYLKTGAAPGKSTSLGPMALVVKNSTSQMSDADLAAMATYLKDIPANSTLRSGKPAPDATRTAGAALYLDHCVACHQAGGRGMPGVFPPLAGNNVVVAADPADILKVVLNGVPPQGKYMPMPGFANQLSDQQIADLSNYVRSSWGNGAAPNTTAAMVARLRPGPR
ncbi:MAG TPA: c-type cytochrome [Rubrivivax sp.]|jgi:mono/diheme cytochrome c family protein|nr:c-type cytochrome [Rubrivivax sp.]